MNANLSDIVYQANAARRREFEAEAANERKAAQVAPSTKGVPDAMRNLRQHAGDLLIALGMWLRPVEDASALKSVTEQ